MATDYKKKYYELKEKEEAELQLTVKELVKDVQENTRISKDNVAETKRLADHVGKQNSRVDKLEKEVFGKVKPSDLPPWWRDPKILGFMFNLTVIIMLILSFVAKVDIGTLLP